MAKAVFTARIRRFWRGWSKKITIYYNMEEVKVKLIF